MLTLSLTTIYSETAASKGGVKTQRACLIYKCNKYPEEFSLCLESILSLSPSGHFEHILHGASVQTLSY